MFGKLILGLLFCTSVWAQPIKMVVPFSPGGQVDIITREAEKIVAQELKRPVLVEYRLGAGSSIGITSVARTKTNEVVLMFIDANALANVMVSNSLELTDFKFLGLLGTTSTALAVVKGSPYKNLKYWTTVKRSINVGTNGVGSPHHFYTYSLGKSMNLPLEAIPYKGIAPAMNDLMNGSIDAMWGSVATLLPFEQAGKIEMIANLSTRRLPMAPNMPTFTELGYPNAGASTHWMIVSNATADPDTLQQIAELFRKIPTDNDLYTKTHILPDSGSAESILKLRIQQQREFAEIIRATKVKQ
jgi:tripartite-type tricarboxylate transporter receptor subunit TctC